MRRRAPCRGDLVGESAHGIAAIGQEIDDLDDRDLSTHGPLELDVDRPRTPGGGIDRVFRAGSPAAGAGHGDNKLLPPKVLDVARQVSPGHGLEKRGELRIDGPA